MEPLGGHPGPRYPRHPLVGPGGHQADLQGEGRGQKRLLELKLALDIASLIRGILLPMLLTYFLISYPGVSAIDLSEMSVEVVSVHQEALDVVAAVPDENMVVKIVQGRIGTHCHDSTLSSGKTLK